MANVIKIKAGSGVPTTSNIVDRELAFDRSNNKLYINDSGTIVDLTGQSSGGPASTADRIEFTAQAGEALSKGDVVYISGLSGNTPIVSKADADDANKMPAFGLAGSSASLNNSVDIVTFGILENMDTSAFTQGDTLFVSTTPGTLSASKPSGETGLIQNIAYVVRSAASVGAVKIGGAGRTAATPNLNEDKIFIGDATDCAVPIALSSVNLTKLNNDLWSGSANQLLTDNGDGTATSESNLIFGGQYLSIQGNDPSNTYGVKEKLRIHRSGANTDRQLQIYEMRHSGGREFLQTFNLDITTDNSTGYTYTQGSYGGSSYLEFDNAGALKIYNDSSVANASRNAITPSLSMWIKDDNNILMPGKLGIGWTAGVPARALDVKGGIELSANDNTLDTNNFTLRRDSGGGGNIDVPGNMTINLDANNNETTAQFEICHDGGSTPVFKVQENGYTTALRYYLEDTGAVIYRNSNDLELITYSGYNINLMPSGNVGIGTTSPTDTLQVEGSIGVGVGRDGQLTSVNNGLVMRSLVSDADMYFYVNDGGVDTLALKIDASDAGTLLPNNNIRMGDSKKIRLGASNDFNLYHDGSNSYIYNESSAGKIIIQNTTSDGDIEIKVNDGGATTNAIIIDASDNSRVKLPNDNQRLSIGASNDIQITHDGSNSYFDNYTGNLNIKNNDADKDLILLCDDGSGGETAYITLDGSTTNLLLSPPGNVGIGTVSPGYKLDVAGTIRTTGEIYLDNGGDAIAFMGVSDANYRKALYANNDDHYVTNRHTGGDLILMSNNGSAGGETERLRFVAGSGTQNAYFSNVNVGIGTTSPSALLDVGGDADEFALIGRARVGYNSHSDWASFQHRDSATNLGFALLQNSSGRTILNAKGGQQLQFRVNNADGTQMIFDGSQLGIGNVTPQAPLHIGTGNTSRHIKVSDSRAMFGYNGSNAVVQGGNTKGIQFHTNTDTFSGSAKMTITSAGNVGIGVTSPLATLDLGNATGERMYVYSNGSAVRAGFGVDLSGSSRELSIFHSSSNQSDGNISFGHRYETGGAYTERMRITGAGNVGIGTTSPESKLMIVDSGETIIRLYASTASTRSGIWFTNGSYSYGTNIGTDNKFHITGNINSESELVTVDSSGNVGIGTTSPSHEMVLRKDQAAETEFSIVNLTSNSSATTNLRFRNATSGSESGNGGLIQLANGNAFKIINQFGNPLIFGTSNAEKMRIDSSGNVGIGETSIDAKLHLTTASSGLVNQKFESAGSSAWRIGVPAGQTYFAFDDSSDDLSSPEVVFTTAGNVGIGTTTPNHNLQIEGGSSESILNLTTTGNSNGLDIILGTDGHAAIWLRENDYMHFATNNTERMRITSAGRVLIGGTSPSGHNYDLEVLNNNAYVQGPDGWNGTGDLAIVALGSSHVNEVFGCGYKYGTGMIMSIYKSGGYGSFGSSSYDAMTILDTSGNVGIGTGTPYDKLDVKSASSTSPAIVANGAAANGCVNMAHGYAGQNGDYVCTYGTQYSSIAMVLGYGVKPSTTANDTFIASCDNANFTRGALVIDDELRFWQAGAQTGTLNNNISMTERFRLTAAGAGHFDSDVVAYSSTVSDKRLKENITTIDNALDKVMALRGVEYDWTATSRKGTHDIGLVAQEVEEVIPELVTEHELCTGEFGGEGNEKTFKTVNYDKMVGVLIEAIKEQQQQINELKEKLNG